MWCQITEVCSVDHVSRHLRAHTTHTIHTIVGANVDGRVTDISQKNRNAIEPEPGTDPSIPGFSVPMLSLIHI